MHAVFSGCVWKFIIDYSVKTIMKSDKTTNISELKEKVAEFIHLTEARDAYPASAGRVNCESVLF